MFQIILLAVFSALAISGILIFALVVGGGGGNAIGPVVIWGTHDPTAFATVLRQAAENESRLAQVSYVQKDASTYVEMLTEALASGTGPDLYLLRQDYVIRDSGKIVPIPYDRIGKSQFEDTFVEAGRPYLGESGVFAVPLFIDPMVMYWNRDLFASAGLAKPPQYWDEFTEAAQRMVKKDVTGAIQKAIIALGEYQNVEHAKDILALLIQQAGGQITLRDATGRLVPALSARTAGATQATESALRFYTEFADPSKVDYSWNRSLPISRAAFSAGDLAVYFGYASEARFLARSNPNLNFALAPMPQIRGSARVSGIARVYALATTRGSKKPEAAMTVASLLAGKDISRALSIALGVPSARRDVIGEREEDENQVVERESLIARSWLDPDPEKTEAIFRAMIESVTSGASRLGETISRADQSMAQIIGQ